MDIIEFYDKNQTEVDRMMAATNLKRMQAGELAALYILCMRGWNDDYLPSEIQDALENLIGPAQAIDAIRKVRHVMKSI